MSTEFVNKMFKDGTIERLKSSLRCSFDGVVAEVKIIKEIDLGKKNKLTYMIFVDYFNRFIKRFELTDFSCERDCHVYSHSDKLTQAIVDDYVVEHNYINFLKQNYPDYKYKFSKYSEERKIMVE